MIVREASVSDYIAVSKIISSVFSEDLKMITSKAVDESLVLPFIEKAGCNIYVAKEQAKILGAIVISRRKLSFSPSLIWFYFKNFGIFASLRSYLRLTMFRKKMPKKLDNEYFIEAIAVDGTARNRGIGRELVVQVEKTLKEKNVKYLGLLVRAENTAVEFYRALGFAKVKDCATRAFGKWYYMRKALNPNFL